MLNASLEVLEDSSRNPSNTSGLDAPAKGEASEPHRSEKGGTPILWPHTTRVGFSSPRLNATYDGPQSSSGKQRNLQMPKLGDIRRRTSTGASLGKEKNEDHFARTCASLSEERYLGYGAEDIVGHSILEDGREESENDGVPDVRTGPSHAPLTNAEGELETGKHSEEKDGDHHSNRTEHSSATNSMPKGITSIERKKIKRIRKAQRKLARKEKKEAEAVAMTLQLQQQAQVEVDVDVAGGSSTPPRLTSSSAPQEPTLPPPFTGSQHSLPTTLPSQAAVTIEPETPMPPVMPHGTGNEGGGQSPPNSRSPSSSLQAVPALVSAPLCESGTEAVKAPSSNDAVPIEFTPKPPPTAERGHPTQLAVEGDRMSDTSTRVGVQEPSALVPRRDPRTAVLASMEPVRADGKKRTRKAKRRLKKDKLPLSSEERKERKKRRHRLREAKREAKEAGESPPAVTQLTGVTVTVGHASPAQSAAPPEVQGHLQERPPPAPSGSPGRSTQAAGKERKQGSPLAPTAAGGGSTAVAVTAPPPLKQEAMHSPATPKQSIDRSVSPRNHQSLVQFDSAKAKSTADGEASPFPVEAPDPLTAPEIQKSHSPVVPSPNAAHNAEPRCPPVSGHSSADSHQRSHQGIVPSPRPTPYPPPGRKQLLRHSASSPPAVNRKFSALGFVSGSAAAAARALQRHSFQSSGGAEATIESMRSSWEEFSFIHPHDRSSISVSPEKPSERDGGSPHQRPERRGSDDLTDTYSLSSRRVSELLSFPPSSGSYSSSRCSSRSEYSSSDYSSSTSFSSSSSSSTSNFSVAANEIPLKEGCPTPLPVRFFLDVEFRLQHLPALMPYAEDAIINEWDLLKGEWVRSETKVVLSVEPFAHGNMRSSYYFIDFSRPNCRLAAKRYLKSSVTREQYFDDVSMHSVSGHWARLYNSMSPPKPVKFVPAAVLELTHRRSPMILAMEPLLEGIFRKYNNNCGYLPENVRWTPQAFSHFTYVYSRNELMIVDIQGVNDIYTDPQILSPDGEGYGRGNLGHKGIKRFFKTHVCNPICYQLGLPQRSSTSRRRRHSHAELSRGSEGGREAGAPTHRWPGQEAGQLSGNVKAIFSEYLPPKLSKPQVPRRSSSVSTTSSSSHLGSYSSSETKRKPSGAQVRAPSPLGPQNGALMCMPVRPLVSLGPGPFPLLNSSVTSAGMSAQPTPSHYVQRLRENLVRHRLNGGGQGAGGSGGCGSSPLVKTNMNSSTDDPTSFFVNSARFPNGTRQQTPSQVSSTNSLAGCPSLGTSSGVLSAAQRRAAPMVAIEVVLPKRSNGAVSGSPGRSAK